MKLNTPLLPCGFLGSNSGHQTCYQLLNVLCHLTGHCSDFQIESYYVTWADLEFSVKHRLALNLQLFAFTLLGVGITEVYR